MAKAVAIKNKQGSSLACVEQLLGCRTGGHGRGQGKGPGLGTRRGRNRLGIKIGRVKGIRGGSTLQIRGINPLDEVAVPRRIEQNSKQGKGKT